MKKQRLDQKIVQLGWADSVDLAKRQIMAGTIIVNSQKCQQPGTLVSETDKVERVGGKPSQFVSRGGEKLLSALKHFNCNLTDKNALDVGISSGGFTDCLLQNGISRVIGVDVSYGLTDFKIRTHPKVALIERCNARLLTPESFKKHLQTITYSKEASVWSKTNATLPCFGLNFVVMDVSFISVTVVLPVIAQLVDPDTEFVILIKPQFEAPKHSLEKGGIVKDEEQRQHILSLVQKKLESKGFELVNQCDAGIKGTKGNQEAFFLLKLSSNPSIQ